MKISKKSKEKFMRFVRNLVDDISYSNGGWLYFVIRMFTNLAILYFVMVFITSWADFAFSPLSSATEFENKREVIHNVVWAIGILFLVLKGFAFTDYSWRIRKIKK